MINVKNIVEDATSLFKQNSKKFWESDEELTESVSNMLQSWSFNSGADTFSTVLLLLSETSVYFEQVGEVGMVLWEPVMQGIWEDTLAKFNDDFNKNMTEIRKNYKAPVAETIIAANNILAAVQSFRKISQRAKGSDAMKYSRDKLFAYTKQLINMYGTLDTSGTTYANGVETIGMYRQTVSDSLDVLLEFCEDSVDGMAGAESCQTMMKIMLDKSVKGRFWKGTEIEESLQPLVCSQHWDDHIEAYEFAAYVINKVYDALSCFGETDKAFWEPVLKLYFARYATMLKDKSSLEYLKLDEYYPLTDPLRECDKFLRRLKELVNVNTDLKGANADVIEAMAMEFHGQISEGFEGTKVTSNLVTNKAAVERYKTIILSSLDCMMKLEAMRESGFVPLPTESAKRKTKAKKDDVQVDEATNVIVVEPVTETVTAPPVQEPVAEAVEPVTPAVEAVLDVSGNAEQNVEQTMAPVEATIEPVVEVSTEDGFSTMAEEQQPVIVEEAPTQPVRTLPSVASKLDMAAIENLLGCEPSEFDLAQFGKQYESLNNYFHYHKNQRHMDDMKFCGELLLQLFAAFDKAHEEVQRRPKSSRDRLGQNPKDWDLAKKNTDKTRTEAKIEISAIDIRRKAKGGR